MRRRFDMSLIDAPPHESLVTLEMRSCSDLPWLSQVGDAGSGRALAVRNWPPRRRRWIAYCSGISTRSRSCRLRGHTWSIGTSSTARRTTRSSALASRHRCGTTKKRRREFRRLTDRLVGPAGFEPATTTPPVWCATRLRYAPTGAPLYADQTQVHSLPARR